MSRPPTAEPRPAEAPPRRPVLFVNPRSGGGAAGRARLSDRARELGIEAIELGPGQRLDELVAAAIDDGADAVGAAGGDGSIATVAAVACARDVPFVCVPAGTRNHFARDLGVDPRDPARALDAFAAGIERRVDVGEVDGRVFLNNVSLGVYGEAVRDAGYRDAKLRTLLQTAEEVLGPGGEAGGLRVVDDLGVEHRGPALLLASNNPYAPRRPGARGVRPALDGGRLGIVVVDSPAPRTPRAPAHGPSPPSSSTATARSSMPGSTASPSTCACRCGSPSAPGPCGCASSPRDHAACVMPAHPARREPPERPNNRPPPGGPRHRRSSWLITLYRPTLERRRSARPCATRRATSPATGGPGWSAASPGSPSRW